MQKNAVSEVIRGSEVVVVAQWKAKQGKQTKWPTFCAAFYRKPKASPE